MGRTALDLVRDAGRTMLVLEDAGAEPLDRLLGAPMEMGRFLGLAIGIAVALGKLHQRGLVHKDIKPANILVNGATGDVRLTGFGIASRVARERQSPHPPETIAGTLAYTAPGTDRTDESVNRFAERLYALGVTFYQNAHRCFAVYSHGPDGMGALPSRQPAGGACTGLILEAAAGQQAPRRGPA